MEINWLSLILFAVAMYGIYEHVLALYDAKLDERAMISLKHNGIALIAVQTDIKDESWRIAAKSLFATFFMITMFNPNSTANSSLGWWGWLAFFSLLSALICLSANTQVRKRARHDMLVESLVHKGRAV